MTLTVHRPGLFTTVQDRGRHGHQHLGVVPCGAMDEAALALANALVGNAGDEAALEVTLLGPELEFGEATLVALCGAEMDGDLPQDRPALVPAGARVRLGRAARGARAYLAVAGGIQVAPVLGSRSTYVPGRFGGLEGRALRRGDALALAPGAHDLSRERFARLKSAVEKNGLPTVRWSAPPLTLPDHQPVLIHAMAGQHYESFEPNAQRAFFDTAWRVAPESNRMGFRLAGAALAPARGGEILSGPTCLGTVQVPSGGTPIALMADHQTTGGYPKIAEIASADVARLAQLRPGDTLHFGRCSLAEALELRAAAAGRLDAALQGIAWAFRK